MVDTTPAEHRRLKVLISAYACEPNKGSEPGVGWNWAVQASRFHEVWVLTRSNNRPAIEAELACRPIANLHFLYHDLPPWASFWHKGDRGLVLYYPLWQLTALFVTRRLQRETGFDLVHQLTFNTIDVPGFLWLLGLPFIWGPVGGAQVTPKGFQRYFGLAWVFEVLRTWRKGLVRLNPLVRLAAARAVVVIAANSDAADRMQSLRVSRLVQELEAAVPGGGPRRPSQSDCPREMTVLWAGSLIYRKAPLLALDAFAELRSRGTPARLLMAGDGPLRRLVEDYVRRLGLEEQVSILGSLRHVDMDDFYRQGQVFFFSSLRDTSGNVILEAMARGLPIVTLDHQGAGEMVSPECGIKVAVVDADQVVADLASALERLSTDHRLRKQLGAGALSRVAALYTWERKGEFIDNLYAQVSREAPVLRTVR